MKLVNLFKFWLGVNWLPPHCLATGCEVDPEIAYPKYWTSCMLHEMPSVDTLFHYKAVS
jgi:hypothetical protein